MSTSKTKRIFKKGSITIDDLMSQFDMNTYQILIVKVKLYKYVSVDTRNVKWSMGYGIQDINNVEYGFKDFDNSILYGFNEGDINTGEDTYVNYPESVKDFSMSTGSKHIAYCVVKDPSNGFYEVEEYDEICPPDFCL